MIALEIDDRERERTKRFLHPEDRIDQDVRAVYQEGRVDVGLPSGAQFLYDNVARDHTVAIIGVMLGDEGKGRVVDNKIAALLEIPGVQVVDVVRFQGGNNAGHTVENEGIKLALHQVPSGVLYPETVGIMDRGMVIHPEDLRAEIAMIEGNVGDTRGKLLLSQDAILVSDLERAEEVFNRVKKGKSGGGTGRGISPAYAHFYDRQGLNISDLLKKDWRIVLGEHYDQYAKLFAAFDMDVSTTTVPDYPQTIHTKKEEKRTVGSREEFLDRMENVRTWLIERQMVANTFLVHKEIFQDMQHGVLFEGAQAVGLHAWLGTRPDVTSSDTSAHGIPSGTGFWRVQDVGRSIGVFKITYTSSVGARHMPTEVPLPKDFADLSEIASSEQFHMAWIRTAAHEFGTTTGRPRDLLHLDLSMMAFNCRMAGIDMLAGTHLDIAKEGVDILVCTHYEDKDGNVIPYQSGLQYQEGVIPQYVRLPGWDGEVAQRAKSFKELPENAQKFLAFIQLRLGIPIVAATTGPARENLVTFSGYTA